MNDQPWYRQLFGEDYLRDFARTPERTAQEVEGIVQRLAPPPGSRILDLCCGHGRHTIPLAQHGYRMTGQDLSEIFLLQARTDAEAQGVQVQWVHSDMREIPFEDEFDAVINIYVSFGYLENEAEDQKVLQQVYKALKPGGLFVIEFINREYYVRHFTPHTITRHEDGLLDLEECGFDLLTSRGDQRRTKIYPDGRRTEHHWSVRWYTITELVRMLAAAGMQMEAYYGGLDGSPLTLDSRRLVLVSGKPRGDEGNIPEIPPPTVRRNRGP
jgi:SAM-dependent methyltransferase